jgi:hypothetical protein
MPPRIIASRLKNQRKRKVSNPTFDERALLEDLVRVLIFDLADRRPFGKNAFNDSPYDRALTELAAKYGVPSITDTGEITRPAPQVPEGKVQNK